MAHPLRPAALALLAALATLPGAAAAQPPTTRTSRHDTLDALDLRVRVEGGGAVSTPLVRGASGTRVVTGVSPTAGVAVARELSSGITFAAGARAALLSLQFRDRDPARWDGGTAWQVDAVAAAERDVLRCDSRRAAGCTTARAGAVVAFLAGPRDVAPFRESGSRWGVGGEAGGAVRLTAGRPLYGTLVGQAFHMFGVTSVLAGPVEAGLVARVVAGVRYGR